MSLDATAGITLSSGSAAAAPSPPVPSLEDEITFISGVDIAGHVAATSYWTNGAPSGRSFAQKWGGDAPGTSGGTVYYNFEASSNWSTVEQGWFKAAFALWSGIANIRFAQADASHSSNLLIHRGNDGRAFEAPSLPNTSVVGGTTLVHPNATGSIISIDTSNPSFTITDLSRAYGIATIVHEVGHALGLGHAGTYNAGASSTSTQYSAYDSRLWSAMSYINPNDNTQPFFSQYPIQDASWGQDGPFSLPDGSKYYLSRAPTTFMPIDVLAVQRLYGVAGFDSTFATNQTFGFNSTIQGDVRPLYDFTQNKNPVVTIWGGPYAYHKLDLSDFRTTSGSVDTTQQIIDMHEGGFTSAHGMKRNIGIAYGTKVYWAVAGAGNDIVYGNDLGDYIEGNAGNDTILGGNGIDTLVGGIGADDLSGYGNADSYYVDNTGDVVHELINGGNDIIYSSVTYALPNNVESLWLQQSLFAVNATGNGLANDIRGNVYFNRLDGGTDILADTMYGGAGGDTYVVRTNDIVVENTDEGSDTVEAFVNYTLGANVENLKLQGTATLGTGNALANYIWANPLLGSTLNGGAYLDTLVGGAGNDTFVLADVGAYRVPPSTYFVVQFDTVIEQANGGTDTVMVGAVGSGFLAGTSYTLTDNVENGIVTGVRAFDLTGNSLNNSLVGNSPTNPQDYASGEGVNHLYGLAGNDTLNGSDGDDSLYGGAGDDLLQVSTGHEYYDGGDGFDTLDFGTLTTYGVFLHLELVQGTTPQFMGFNTYIAIQNIEALIGTDGADTFYGPNANQTYSLGSGNDTLYAGSGNDQATGGVGDDSLDGGAGSDRLDGGIGADTLVGGLGNETYIVDNTGDVIVEQAGEGTDRVLSQVSYTLSDNVESLQLSTNLSLSGIGNALNNTLIGNRGRNRLNGMAGADTMTAGAGDDIYVVDNAGDVVVELAGEGIDQVLSQVSYTLGDNVENLQLATSLGLSGTGNALANLILGNGGANVLDGRGGADTLTGGAKADTFVLRAGETVGDTVTDFVRGTDKLAFYGFGTNAMLSHAAGSDLYTVTSGNGVTNGSFRLTGVSDLDLSMGSGNTDARFFA